MGEYLSPRRLSVLALALNAVAVFGWMASAQGWVESLDAIFVMLGMALIAVLSGSAALLRGSGERSDRARAVVAIAIGLVMSAIGVFLFTWRG